MSEKRRDNKGRILRTGESQRKDGRYAYKYVDAFGKPQFVYSWKLVATDKTPAGKRDVPALRYNVPIDVDMNFDPNPILWTLENTLIPIRGHQTVPLL